MHSTSDLSRRIEPTPGSLTHSIAAFVSGLKFDTIPGEAIDRAKVSILDGLGCALGGLDEPAAKFARQQVMADGGNPISRLIGTASRVSPQQAAWVNGTAMHALDYDDYTLTSWIGHPTVAILPALLALAESIGATGRELLTAYVAGYEAGAWIGHICAQRHYDVGWHNTATIGSVASAAACSRMLRLPVAQTARAIGIGASMAGGLRENFGTMTKPLHAGNAARNGVVAAQLAREGLTSSERILEGHAGFIRALAGGLVFELADNGHTRWDIVDPGIAIKPYPCCAYSHWAIDAAIGIRGGEPDIHRRIESIEIRSHPGIPAICIHHRPETGLEEKFSLEFCIAAALVDGHVGLDTFSGDRVQNAAYRRLIERARYIHPPEHAETPFGGTLAVVKMDGARKQHTILHPAGSPGNPARRDAVERKFLDCAGSVISPLDANRIVEAVGRCELLDAIGDLLTTVA